MHCLHLEIRYPGSLRHFIVSCTELENSDQTDLKVLASSETKSTNVQVMVAVAVGTLALSKPVSIYLANKSYCSPKIRFFSVERNRPSPASTIGLPAMLCSNVRVAC